MLLIIIMCLYASLINSRHFLVLELVPVHSQLFYFKFGRAIQLYDRQLGTNHNYNILVFLQLLGLI